jgi:predicted ATPase with chaperone activity
MLFKTISAAVYGIDANIIEVEVDVSGIRLNDGDHFMTVGLPDAAVRESRERIRAALRNCGYDIPPTHITVNLAPADIKKEGSGFDLPMAMGILGAYGALMRKEVVDWLLVGDCRSMAACVAFAERCPSQWKPAPGRFATSSFLKPTHGKLPWSAAWTSFRCARSSTWSTC